MTVYIHSTIIHVFIYTYMYTHGILQEYIVFCFDHAAHIGHVLYKIHAIP